MRCTRVTCALTCWSSPMTDKHDTPQESVRRARELEGVIFLYLLPCDHCDEGCEAAPCTCFDHDPPDWRDVRTSLNALARDVEALTAERVLLLAPIVDDAGALQVLVDFVRDKHDTTSFDGVGGCEVCAAVDIAQRALKDTPG